MGSNLSYVVTNYIIIIIIINNITVAKVSTP